MKIFTIIGYTNSGKTRTLEEIIKELVRRGYSVNTVKNVHIENFSIDTEGKDSWRHREAGATVTGVRSNIETAIIFQRRMNAKELIPYFNCDFLALEGFSDETSIPKILCAKDLEDLDERFDKTVFAISGVVANEVTEYIDVKSINSLLNIKALVDLIEKHAIDKEEFLAKG
ncbi:MAG: molybdopterin-guanine dinucleotide biosynthesis protein B [Candidatus Thorarchaeota archaeon]